MPTVSDFSTFGPTCPGSLSDVYRSLSGFGHSALGRRRVFDAYLGPLAPQIRAGQPEPVLVDEPPVVEHGPLGGLAAQAIAVFRRE